MAKENLNRLMDFVVMIEHWILSVAFSVKFIWIFSPSLDILAYYIGWVSNVKKNLFIPRINPIGDNILILFEKKKKLYLTY
jgi:hypothetical protein